MQNGAAYVKTLIDAVMNGPNWQDTVFILTFDEPGGFFDHVAPIGTVNPDGVLPKDLHAGDVCTAGTGPTCDFVFTGSISPQRRGKPPPPTCRLKIPPAHAS
jgi:phospholipase C